MYINNKKRKLDSRDLDTVQNAEYFTCVYYRPRGQSTREEYKTYKEAYLRALFMFYAVKGTSQCHIGGLK